MKSTESDREAIELAVGFAMFVLYAYVRSLGPRFALAMDSLMFAAGLLCALLTHRSPFPGKRSQRSRRARNKEHKR